MNAAQSLRVQVAEECGPDFTAALRDRLSAAAVTIGPLDGRPADVAVVGGRDVVDDLASALRAGVGWIQTLTSGVERVLTTDVRDSGVLVTNAAAATARPVAEFAMARVLEHVKQLPAIRHQQLDSTWEPRWLDCLAGSTMTVVGLGHIGSRVARLASAFEAHVIGVRRNPSNGGSGCDEVLPPEELGTALAQSDHCVVAAALTDATVGLISGEVLARARDGLFLVNVSRGELVDVDSLRREAIAGRLTAALDVFPEEPLPATDPLWSTPGIRVSSHTATLTPRLIDWLVDVVATNVQRYASGLPLLDVVDTGLGYPASRVDGTS